MKIRYVLVLAAVSLLLTSCFTATLPKDPADGVVPPKDEPAVNEAGGDVSADGVGETFPEHTGADDLPAVPDDAASLGEQGGTQDSTPDDGAVVTAPDDGTAGTPLVTDAVDYRKPITVPDTGEAYQGTWSEHMVVLPKLAGDSDTVNAINQKLYALGADTLDTLQNGQEGYNIARITYEYKERDGIVGILVCTLMGAQYSEYALWYDAVYYDSNTDKELTLDEYLTALGSSYEAYTASLNAAGVAVDEDQAPLVFDASKTANPYVMNVIADGESAVIVYYYEGGLGGFVSKEIAVTP